MTEQINFRKSLPPLLGRTTPTYLCRHYRSAKEAVSWLKDAWLHSNREAKCDGIVHLRFIESFVALWYWGGHPDGWKERERKVMAAKSCWKIKKRQDGLQSWQPFYFISVSPYIFVLFYFPKSYNLLVMPPFVCLLLISVLFCQLNKISSPF